MLSVVAVTIYLFTKYTLLFDTGCHRENEVQAELILLVRAILAIIKPLIKVFHLYTISSYPCRKVNVDISMKYKFRLRKSLYRGGQK